MYKSLTIGLALSFLCALGLASVSIAETDKDGREIGPVERVLETKNPPSKKPKKVRFPHRLHQNELKLDCATCHHGQDAAGKQVAYTKGMKIEKCESCHYKGAAGMGKKVDSFKDVGHGRCRVCHKAKAKEDKKKFGHLKNCKTCHDPKVQ